MACAWLPISAAIGGLLLAAAALAQDVPSEPVPEKTAGAEAATTERGAGGILVGPLHRARILEMQRPAEEPGPALRFERFQRDPAFARLATAPAAPSWVARHGLTSGQYQAAFEDYAKQGLRLIQVSGYTSGGAERYAALWERSGGPPWVARHGMSSADYQAAFNDYVGQGYRLVHVSGWQAGGEDRFAAIWEQRGGPAWAARHGLDAAQYQQAFDEYAAQGYRLVHVDGWGAGHADRYAAIWEQSDGRAWVARHGLDAAQYQQAFDEYTAQGYRLARVSGYEVAGRDRYAGIWEQTDGPLWTARHGIPGAHYQHVFDNQLHQGWRPVYLDAFTSGNAERFDAIWTNQSMSYADLTLITEKAHAYLVAEGVPGLALAIAQDGRLVYAAGFGWADASSGEEASPTHRFRVASVSKPITSVAILRLVEQGVLQLGQTVFGPGGLLGARYPTPPSNPLIDQITVQELLQHVGGFSNAGGDTMFMNTGLNHDQLITWTLANQLLPVVPGTRYEYSNFGYCLLGRIIEQVTGQGYEAFVRANVLAPAGIQEMAVAFNAASQRQPNEVVYQPAGAYSLNVRRFDSHGGWIASPIDLLRFVVHVDGLPSPPDIISDATRAQMTMAAGIPDVDGNDPNYALGWTGGASNGHNGAMTGTLAVIVRTDGNLSYAVVVNTRPAGDGFAGKLQAMMDDILAGVPAWPAHDLF
jgi:CubicO group peptidase (beta-lactamase class C family)